MTTRRAIPARLRWRNASQEGQEDVIPLAFPTLRDPGDHSERSKR